MKLVYVIAGKIKFVAEMCFHFFLFFFSFYLRKKELPRINRRNRIQRVLRFFRNSGERGEQATIENENDGTMAHRCSLTANPRTNNLRTCNKKQKNPTLNNDNPTIILFIDN